MKKPQEGRILEKTACDTREPTKVKTPRRASKIKKRVRNKQDEKVNTLPKGAYIVVRNCTGGCLILKYCEVYNAFFSTCPYQKEPPLPEPAVREYRTQDFRS